METSRLLISNTSDTNMLYNKNVIFAPKQMREIAIIYRNTKELHVSTKLNKIKFAIFFVEL